MTTTVAHDTESRNGHPGDTDVDPRRLWTMQQVAEMLKIPLATAYDLRAAGVIPANRMGKRWMLADSALIRLINGAVPTASDADLRQTWTVPQVAEQLHLHKDTVYDLIADGHITAISLGKHLRIADSEVLRLVCEGARSRSDEAA